MDNVKILKTTEFENWLVENDGHILPCDSGGYIMYVHQATEEVVGIKFSDVSEFIKYFRNEKHQQVLKNAAKDDLKRAYKNALKYGVDVEYTKEWFESL